MSAFGDMILDKLREHRGAENCISAPQIALELGYGASFERIVRVTIADESPTWKPSLVCAIPGRGYFVAETLEEALSYHSWLKGIENQAIMKRESFEKVCLSLGLNLTGLPVPA